MLNTVQAVVNHDRDAVGEGDGPLVGSLSGEEHVAGMEAAAGQGNTAQQAVVVQW
jgi:hypothetical protein